MMKINVQIVRPSIQHFKDTKASYLNKNEGFATGIDLIAEEQSGILNQRAERFQLEGNKPSISAFYKSMGIDVINRKSVEMKKLRFDALHMRGVQDLNQNEVLSYFDPFCPSEVEWINDISCNVIFPDEGSAVRALFYLTKDLPDIFPVIDLTDSPKKNEAPDVSILVVDNKEDDGMDIDDSPASQSESVEIPVPPGHWRLGNPHPKAKTILLRFAKKDDKKLPGAEKRSKYYQIHGNPHYGGLKGLISSSKKQKVQAQVNRLAVQKEANSSYESFSSHDSATSAPKITKHKRVRMRMYADEEELITRKSRCKTHFNNRTRSVHSRLGKKYTAYELYNLGESTNGFQDSDKITSYPRKYQDLDDPKVCHNSSAFQHSSYPTRYQDHKPKVYRNSDKFEVYRNLHKPRSNRNLDKNSSSRTYDYPIKPKNSTWDLRSKLKRNKNIKQYQRQHSQSYDGEITDKKISRVDELSSRSVFKRKHRSPLCEDDDDEEEDEDDDKISFD